MQGYYLSVGTAVGKGLSDPDDIESEERQIHNAMIVNQNIEEDIDGLRYVHRKIRKYLDSLKGCKGTHFEVPDAESTRVAVSNAAVNAGAADAELERKRAPAEGGADREGEKEIGA